jgi:excinuclease ABC subunit A
VLLAPKIRGQKGEYRDLFAELARQGFVRARVDGEIIELADPPELDRYHRHDIEVVVDRLIVRPGLRPRLAEALELALTSGDGAAIVMVVSAEDAPAANRKRKRRAAGRPSHDILLSAGYACTTCGLSFEPPTPQMFSFNSPHGMCQHCDGLGARFDFDPELLVPDPSRSFLDPCVAALRRPPGRWRRHIYEGVARHLGIDLKTRWRDLPQPARDALLYGTGEAHITFEWRGRHGVWMHGGTYEGIVAELQTRHRKTSSAIARRFYEQFMRQATCPRCRGARLNAPALAVRLSSRQRESDGEGSTQLNIDEVCRLPIERAVAFFDQLELEGVERQIAEEPLKEIRARLRFLDEVGLGYLALDRSAPTLAGGESQRIRLASQIGCGLVGVLYVLDEPSIGLHPRDNRRLLESLQRLRDMGNTVIVVEHDRDTMEAADRIVDFGPGAGVRGGEIVAEGSLRTIAESPNSLTGAYLSGRESIETPAARRPVTRRPRPNSLKPSRRNAE